VSRDDQKVGKPYVNLILLHANNNRSAKAEISPEVCLQSNF